jgi:hypothetical protein
MEDDMKRTFRDLGAYKWSADEREWISRHPSQESSRPRPKLAEGQL